MCNAIDRVSAIVNLAQATPNISIIGNASQQLRQLDYCRSKEGVEASLQLQLQRYDKRGQFSHLFDARATVDYLERLDAATANYQQITSLSGNRLQTLSVDAGMQTFIHDIRGKPLYGIDSRGIEQQYEYDEVGRLIARYEQLNNQEKRCQTRFEYGDKSTKEINGINRLIKHYDTAGSEEIGAYGIQGQVLSQRRRFATATKEIDWFKTLAQNESLLEKTFYETQWQFNALGQILNQTDAEGNRRGCVYDKTGQIKATDLQLKEQHVKKVLAEDYVYSASGQLLGENLFNGVMINYRYEVTTQRLQQIETIRRRDKLRLQDVNYHYDPVGNVVEVSDQSKAHGYYANQKTESTSHYVYDSLYQLIEASGIESQQAGKESHQLSKAIPLGNQDASRCVNYVRRYQYDASGNLYAMQHSGAQSYTKKIRIDTQSNRGIEETDTKRQTLQPSFDGNGNLLYLDVGQPPLVWDGQNQLKRVMQLARTGISDEEYYVYDGNQQRIEKTTIRLAKNQLHTQRVRYLPGLEIRESWQSDLEGNDKKINEVLHVIQAQAGGNNVRVLHWEQGKPESLDNHNSCRLSLTDKLGSSELELNETADILSYESYYPYGGTAIWSMKNQSEVNYKFIRYSGKERDSTGLYYYGYRYYVPWLGRWLNPDPSGIADGLNLFKMSHNNPITWADPDGRAPFQKQAKFSVLYPLQHDEAGNAFHHMSDIHHSREGKKRILAIDVKVLREGIGPNKKDFLLFQGATQAERLMVFAHGSHGKFGAQAQDITHLQPDSPTITVLGPHNRFLGSSEVESGTLLNTVKRPYAKISYEEISFYSEQALVKSYKNVTGTKIKKAIQNYSIKKFETRESGKFMKHPLESIAYSVAGSRRSELGELDILTLRKHASKYATSGDIINLAQKKGYKEVIFHFCRNITGYEDSEESLEAWKVLENPNSDAAEKQNALEVASSNTYFDIRTTLLDKPVELTWGLIHSIPRFGRGAIRAFLSSFSGNK